MPGYRQRIYERYGSLFQDSPSLFDEIAVSRWGRAYRHYLRGWLPPDRNAAIVDLACGSGRLLHFFKTERYRNVRGVDVSPEQVRLASQITTDVVEGDVIEFLESARGSFDLITGLDIIEHFHKPEVLRFLDACYAALRPRGRLVLQTSNADSPWGSMHRYGDFTHEVGFNPNVLTRLLRVTGLSEIESRETGPVPLGYSVASTMRFVIWRVIRAGLGIWNLAEIGNKGSGVFTRIFLISGIKE